MGVELTGNQLLKASFLDAEFTPVGHKGDVGVALVSGLKEVNYFAELEAKASLSQRKNAGPRFNQMPALSNRYILGGSRR